MASERAFFCTSVLLFILCTILTVLWCDSMSGMSEMLMPGGWTMSMTWMGL